MKQYNWKSNLNDIWSNNQNKLKRKKETRKNSTDIFWCFVMLFHIYNYENINIQQLSFAWVKTVTFFMPCAYNKPSTTISTIPLTSTIVVYIITISITFPTLPITSICATRRWCWRGSTCISNLRYLERFKFQPHSEIIY